MGQQSFTPEEILAASFAYTRSTVEGAGAIKGKNCQIQSIDPITGGVRITFVWYLDDGTEQTDTADVMNGADGKGIKSVAINSNEHLIITYTDNTTSDAGKIEVQSAVTSVNGKKGDVVLKTSDITNDSDYVSDANYVHTDNNYDDTAKGIVDGVTAELAKKVDKVTGKDLSTNDYTNTDKAIVDNVTTNLAGKVDKVTGKGLSTNDYTNADKAIVDGVTTALANKVDKVSGKDLSTNDYTNTDKAIVDGVTAELANKADTTDVIDSASYDSTNHTILFKHGSTTLFSLDAAAFVKDGMIDNVTVTGGNLVITFNTDAGKQNISIPISDIFDANNYYNKTAIDNLLGTKQDTLTFDNTPTANSNNPVKSGGVFSALSNKQNTLTFDNTPTENSNNPVKSGGVYAEVNSLKETLTNYVTDMGVKNLFNFRKEDKSFSSSGITFITNDDGTVTIKSGTSTSYAHYPQGYNAGEVYKDLKPNTKYIADFGVALSAGGALSVYYKKTSSSSWELLTYATSERELKFTTPNSYYEIWVRYTISSNQTISSDITLYPMVREDIGANDTFELYAKTNQQLTQETTGLISNDFTNGVVNMLPNTGTTQVKDGVTFTVNSDGTVTVNGTTGSSAVDFRIAASPFEVGKSYKLSGCPSGGSTNTYMLYNGNANQITETGEGKTFTFVSGQNNNLYIGIRANQTVSNLVFKPMLTVADMPNSDYNHYVPYAMSNKELTDAITSKVGILSTTSLVTTNALEFRQFGKVVAVNGFLTLDGNQITDGTTANDLGTVSGIDLPNNNRSIRTVCGIARNAWEKPVEVGYLTFTTTGVLQLKLSTSGVQNVYFSFSYVVA